MDRSLFYKVVRRDGRRLALLAASWFLITMSLPMCAFGSGTPSPPGINGSPHNLTISKNMYDQFGRVCIFCHAPHNAKSANDLGMTAPLWNRDLSWEVYSPYVSPTMVTPDPGSIQPTGASRLCLSCHDGTIALGNYGGSAIYNSPMMTGITNLTTDLSNDHPISIAYPTSAGLLPASALPKSIKLEQPGDILQCTSCHDPHNNEYGNFLVIDNTLSGAPLCSACHTPSHTVLASHTPINNPVFTGCMDCHIAHNAPVAVHLLKDPSLCVSPTCHGGSVSPALNIQAILATNVTQSASVVPLAKTAGKGLSISSTGFHNCVDCHNPHQTNNQGVTRTTGITTSSPLILKGALKGVKGVSSQTLATTVARTEYEICYRCHSGVTGSKANSITASRPNRMITEPDQMKRFDGQNPSFHPVAADRRSNGASLLSQFQAGMVRIACSDCHNSDQSRKAGGVGPNGPHGSQFEHLLMARYTMPPVGMPNQGYSAALYDLCFRCHSESYIMGAQSGFRSKTFSSQASEHAIHVKDRGIPCFVCHDPHGVPWQDGATAVNNAHLINFDRTYTVSMAVPNPVYMRIGPSAGSCTVSCHPGGKRSYGQ